MPLPVDEEMHHVHDTLLCMTSCCKKWFQLVLVAPLKPSSRENSQIVEKNISPVAALRRSSRSRIPSKKYVDFLLTEKFEIVILKYEEPTGKWLEAMNSEMESMSENQVLDFVD